MCHRAPSNHSRISNQAASQTRRRETATRAGPGALGSLLYQYCVVQLYAFATVSHLDTVSSLLPTSHPRRAAARHRGHASLAHLPYRTSRVSLTHHCFASHYSNILGTVILAMGSLTSLRPLRLRLRALDLVALALHRRERLHLVAQHRCIVVDARSNLFVSSAWAGDQPHLQSRR